LIFTVAVSPDPAPPGVYEHTQRALKRIDESLAMSGTDKNRILSAIVYIACVARKEEMNRAWDEWADRANPRACLGVDLEPPQRNGDAVAARPPHSQNFSRLPASSRNMPCAPSLSGCRLGGVSFSRRTA
jgi:enamine deaminase RidA (YjgF/YER057c/UK114 family)